MKIFINSLVLFFGLVCFLFFFSYHQSVSGEQNENILIASAPIKREISANVNGVEKPGASESFYIRMYFSEMLEHIEIHDDQSRKYVPYIQGISCFLPDTDFNATAYDARVRVGAGQTRHILFPSSNVYKIEIVRGIGEKSADGTPKKPTFAARYIDLSIPSTAWTRLTIQADGKFGLGYDTDKSYRFLNSVNPTVILQGKDAEDLKEPNLKFDVKYSESTAIVSIIAIDEETGIKNIRYSLDGKHFRFYSEPFSVNYSSEPIKVEAFADDKAANRSPGYSRIINFKTKSK